VNRSADCNRDNSATEAPHKICVCASTWSANNKLFYHWNKLEMLDNITPHVPRHSFASLAADLGLSDSLIAGLLGHKMGNITSRYLHIGDKALIDARDFVANETLELMQKKSDIGKF
jgi:integrase